MAAGITASNLRRINKGPVLASVDLTIPAWHMRISCLWLSNDEGEWIALPSSKFTAASGKTIYTKLIEFTDEVADKRFQAAALAAVHQADRESSS